MDLSKILSNYDDDGDDDRGTRSPPHQHHHNPQFPPYPPPQQQQQERDWSADEMRCAVSILQDFHHPEDASAAVSSSSSSRSHNLPRVRVAREERKTDGDDDDDEVADEDDDMDTKSHTSDAATSGWASGSDLMSKLDLLVQADEIIQSSSAAAAAASRGGTTGDSATAGFARSGVWMFAEEEYAAALIYYFLKGLLPLREGTTLRKFLAEQLCCNRRRVSMKLATESIAGKRIPRKVGASVFVAAPDATSADRALAGETLESLRARCFDPLASPTLESRPRPNKQNDELPELLLNEPTPAPPLTQQEPPKMSWGLQRPSDDERKPSAAPAKSSATSFLRVSTTPKLETTPKKSLRAYRPVPELLQSPLGSGNIKRRKPTIIRTGFETVEEDKYVAAMFEFFMAGALDIPEGTRLVSFLCEQLACSPKTLSMKLAPRRLGERRFPDNVGSITYMRKDSAAQHDRETVESTLQALRFACFDYANTTPNPPTQPKPSQRSAVGSDTARERKHSNASSSGGAPSPNRFTRSGPWSREEEVYAAGLIDCFFKGVLEITEGTTLRAFLSTRLRCNPMRVSKKLASEWIADIKIPKKLGSSTFVRRASASAQEHAEADDVLSQLQQAFQHAESIKDDTAITPTAGTKHSRAEEPQDGDDDEEEEEEEDDYDERLAASSESASSSSSEEEGADDVVQVKSEEDGGGRQSPRKVRRVLDAHSSSSDVKKASRRKLMDKSFSSSPEPSADEDVDMKSEPQLPQRALAY